MLFHFLVKSPGYEEKSFSNFPRTDALGILETKSYAWQVYCMSGGCLSILIALAAVRLYVKKRILKTRTKDDTPFLIAIACIVVYIVMVIVLVYNDGHGMYQQNTAPSQAFTMGQLRLSLALESLYSPVVWIAKLPLFLMYLEVFGLLKWLRYLTWTVIVTTGLFFLALMIIVPVSCSPTKGSSEGDYFQSIGSEACKLVSCLNCTRAGINVAMDLFLLILPMPIIWSLRLSVRRKLGLSTLILTGLLGCFCSCLAVVYCMHQIIWYEGIKDGDVQTIPSAVWKVMIAEMTCALTVSAAPSLLVFCREVLAPFTSSLTKSRGSLRSNPFKSSIARTEASESSNTELCSGLGGEIWQTREYSVNIVSDSDSRYRIADV